MKVEGILARKAGAQSEVEWLCRSGVEISKYILSQQMMNTQEPYDSLNQSWAGGPGSTNGLNPLLDSINLTNSAWGDGSVLGLLYPDEEPGEGCEVCYRNRGYGTEVQHQSSRGKRHG